MEILRRPVVLIGLGILLGLAAGWILAGPRYQFKSEGIFTVRYDVRTGEVVIYGVTEGKAWRRELTKEADKTP